MNCADPFALEIAPAGSGKDRLSDETVLNPQGFFHRGPQIFCGLN
jgi:hypothetical protein